MNEFATFGGGCFWCLEAVFERLPGVVAVVSGYAGGRVTNPTYHQVCSGETGHAEVVRIKFDPARITFDQLLDVFWLAHDPTTRNRQGADVGTQYRSIILFHSAEQEAAARRSLERVNNGLFGGQIVTELVPAGAFYPAEEYHQDYFRTNAAQPYCQAVIRPKLLKLQRHGVIPE